MTFIFVLFLCSLLVEFSSLRCSCSSAKSKFSDVTASEGGRSHCGVCNFSHNSPGFDRFSVREVCLALIDIKNCLIPFARCILYFPPSLTVSYTVESCAYVAKKHKPEKASKTVKISLASKAVKISLCNLTKKHFTVEHFELQDSYLVKSLNSHTRFIESF